MNHSAKGFALPLLLIIIAALAIGGGVYYAKKEKNAQIITIGQQAATTPTTTSTPLVSNSSKVVATSKTESGLKTYSNAQYSISFNFPSYITLNTQKSNSSKTFEVRLASPNLNGTISLDYTGTGYEFNSVQSAEDITVGGIPTSLRIFESADQKQYAVVNFDNNGVRYNAIFNYNKNNDQKEVVKSILKSITFTK